MSEPRNNEKNSFNSVSNRKTDFIIISTISILLLISVFSIPLFISLIMLAINLMALKIVRPAYAFYDRAHVHLTQAAIWMIGGIAGTQGIMYSCWDEVEKYKGEPPWDGHLDCTQGLLWGCIAEDYLGDRKNEVDYTIVKHHYYNPASRGGLTDWEGADKALGFIASQVAIFSLAGGNTSAPVRAQMWWDTAIKAYEHGSIRDAYSFLGRVVHLLEDMGCPAHARNDNHLGVLKIPYIGKEINFPEIDDKLHWDSLEQFCEGQKSPVHSDIFIHIDKYEIKKYFPFVSESDGFVQLKNYIDKPPYEKYIDDKIKDPLSHNELEIACSHEIREYLELLARNTGEQWLSEDTIPGNATRTRLTNSYYEDDKIEKTKSMINKKYVIDAWEELKLDELNITEKKMGEYIITEFWLGTLDPEIHARVRKRDISSSELNDWMNNLSRERNEKLQKELSTHWPARIWDLWESYKKYDFMKNIIPTSQKDFLWQILNRRRYRLTVKYLEAIMLERVPIITKKAAALIQRFYDSVRHVDIRGENEKKTRNWRDNQIIFKFEEPNYIWLENCGGLREDFLLEIEGIPEGWKVDIEKDEKESGCDLIDGEMAGTNWRGKIVGVETTPESIANKGDVKKPVSLEQLIKNYQEPYNGKRGAKLKITITPPKKEKITI